MHARELAELAALISTHGPVFVRSGLPIPERNIEEYWVASKCRLDRWGRTLKQISTRAAQEGRNLFAHRGARVSGHRRSLWEELG